MGTRNLTAVYSNGELKVAQYGQWDGYPEGQGATVINFLNSLSEESFEQFLNNLHACYFYTEKEIDDLGDDWMQTYPQLSRDHGADILNMVLDEPLGLVNSIEFAKYSLFCEWAYIIDFDNTTLEVYTGFQTEPIAETERFYSEELRDYSVGEQYYPIKLLKSYDLDNLPDNDTFTTELNELTYDEEDFAEENA